MKSLLVICSWAFFYILANDVQAASISKLDSAHSDFYQLYIDNGLIYTSNRNLQIIKTQITQQLKFLVGYLNSFNAGPDLQRLEISEIKAQKAKYNQKVTYKARMTLAWPKSTELPENLLIYLPEQGSQHFINFFTQTYKSGKYGDCLEKGHDTPDPSSFFYYYRPLKDSCLIKKRIEGSNDLLVTMNATVTPSTQITADKKPAYKQIWQDNELTVFVICGKYEKNGKDHSDPGIESFIETYQQLVKTFGIPYKSNISTNVTPGPSRPFLELFFQLPNQKKMTIRILLVSEMQSPTTYEIYTIQKYTAPSDIIIYNGHAGLGLSSNKLAEIATFQKDRYQIYFMDSCDTFSYLGKRLFTKAQIANDGKKGGQFVDTITNSMPSFFPSAPSNTIHILESLVAGTDTYFQLLSNLDEAQRSVVDGEEDN